MNKQISELCSMADFGIQEKIQEIPSMVKFATDAELSAGDTGVSYVTTQIDGDILTRLILNNQYLTEKLETLMQTTLPQLVYSNTVVKSDAGRRISTLSTLFVDSDTAAYYTRIIFSNRSSTKYTPSVWINYNDSIECVSRVVSALNVEGIDLTLTYGQGLSTDNVNAGVDMTMLVYKNGFPAGMIGSEVFLTPNV